MRPNGRGFRDKMSCGFCVSGFELITREDCPPNSFRPFPGRRGFPFHPRAPTDIQPGCESTTKARSHEENKRDSIGDGMPVLLIGHIGHVGRMGMPKERQTMFRALVKKERETKNN